jgi:hypothetical protein
MGNTLFPKDQAHVVFTDMQGIQRKGFYKKDSNGYIEAIGKELPSDPEYVYPEDEITEWEYAEEKGTE